MQSRSMSLVETVTSVAIGYVVAICTTLIVLPAFGFDVQTAQAFGISAVFTVVSIARGYAVRRLFNGKART